MKCAGVRHRQTVSCKATSCSKLPGWELMTVCFSNSYCWHAKSFSSTLSSSKYKRRSYAHTDLFINVYLCLYIVNIFFLGLVRLFYFAFLASWVNLLWFMMYNICVKTLKSFWASLYVLSYMVMDELLLVICSGKIDTYVIMLSVKVLGQPGHFTLNALWVAASFQWQPMLFREMVPPRFAEFKIIRAWWLLLHL